MIEFILGFVSGGIGVAILASVGLFKMSGAIEDMMIENEELRGDLAIANSKALSFVVRPSQGA